MSANIDMSHPLVQYACSINVLRKGRGGEAAYVIDPEGAERLRHAILSHRRDLDSKPIARALVGLLALAGWLYEDAGAKDAGATLFRVICEAAPQLPVVDHGGRVMKKVRRFQAMLGESSAAPAARDEPPPAGAVKVSNMEGFQSDRMLMQAHRRKRR